MEEMGKTIGKEAQANDVSIVLGPAVNIKRSPLCGRNFEYYSEDPYLAGEIAEVTGVTTMQMDAGLDTGDMLLKTEVAITAEETGESLHDKLAKAGAALCVETLERLQDGTLKPEKQGESPTPYAKMLDKKMGNIDWTRPAAEIERLVRGLNSWPSAYTHWDKKVMKIWKAKVVS